MPGAAWLFGVGALQSLPLDPAMLPGGPGFLGPLATGWSVGREAVVLDPDDCSLGVAIVDADAGPYAHDVRVARTWTEKGWSYADDWSVWRGMLQRPGRRAVPVGDVPETLALDKAGRVISRSLNGRIVHILRDGGGAFLGMEAGTARADLRFDESGRLIAAGSGAVDTTKYTFEGTQLVAATRGEATTHYTYAGGALSTILWADSGLLRVEADGTSGVGGRWRCSSKGGDTRLVGSGGESWGFSRRGTDWVTTGPSGARVESEWRDGALTSWRDPNARRVEITRSKEGKIDLVRQDGSERIRISRSDGIAAIRVDGAEWTLRRNQAGAIVARSGPDGRVVSREVDALGLPVRVAGGSDGFTIARDGAGRPNSLRAGTVGELRIERDSSGFATRVFDAGGGEWKIERGTAGRVATVQDPSGARWDLRWDILGKFTGITSPDGYRVGVVRQGDQVSQVVAGASSRWSFLRDPAGNLAGLRFPTGRLWGLARDGAGALVQARTPEGRGVSLSRDEAGNITRVGGVEVRRDGRGQPTALVESGRPIVSWKRDGSGRITSVTSPGVDLNLDVDPTGNVVGVKFGDQRVVLARDPSGRVVRAGDTQLQRNGGGQIVSLAADTQTWQLGRDLRGRVERVTRGDEVWHVGRDAVGRIATLSGPGGLEVGANWETGGELAMVRLDGGVIVRRNTSADAGEILAFDAAGDEIGSAGWTLDDDGVLDSLRANGTIRLARDANGEVIAAEAEGETWRRTETGSGGWDGLELTRSNAGEWSLSVGVDGDRVFGMEPGTAQVRTDASGVLTGVDGPGGGVALMYDAIGRLLHYSSQDRDVELVRDGFGRLLRVGGTEVGGWDGILRWGEQTRAPVSRVAVARPGGVLMFDPRGFPLLLPWVGALRAWPTGFVPGIETAELGPGGRVAVASGGPIVSLVDAVNPLTGAVMGGSVPFPWAIQRTEPPPALSPFASPDAASPRDWDPAPWAAADAWADPAEALVALGLLGGGPRESDGIPGVPWLPASFAARLSPLLAGTGGMLGDEDAVTTYVIDRALHAAPMDRAGLFRTLAGDDLAREATLPPGLGPDLPAFMVAPLASEPFGH